MWEAIYYLYMCVYMYILLHVSGPMSICYLYVYLYFPVTHWFTASSCGCEENLIKSQGGILPDSDIILSLRNARKIGKLYFNGRNYKAKYWKRKWRIVFDKYRDLKIFCSFVFIIAARGDTDTVHTSGNGEFFLSSYHAVWIHY